MAGSSLFGGFQNLPSSPDLRSSEERQLVHLLKEIDKTVSHEHAKLVDELAKARLCIHNQEIEIQHLWALLKSQDKNELPIRCSLTSAQYEAEIAEQQREIQNLKDENQRLKMQIQASYKQDSTSCEAEASHKRISTNDELERFHKQVSTNDEPERSHKRVSTNDEPECSHKRVSTNHEAEVSHKRISTNGEREVSQNQVSHRNDKLNKKIMYLEHQIQTLESQLQTRNHEMLDLIQILQDILSGMEKMKRLIDNGHTDVLQQGSELRQDIEHIIESAMGESRKFVTGLERRTTSELFLKINDYVRKKYFS